MTLLGIALSILGGFCVALGFADQFGIRKSSVPQGPHDTGVIGTKCLGAGLLLAAMGIFAVQFQLGFGLVGIGLILMMIGGFMNPNWGLATAYSIRSEVALWLFCTGIVSVLFGFFTAL